MCFSVFNCTTVDMFIGLFGDYTSSKSIYCWHLVLKTHSPDINCARVLCLCWHYGGLCCPLEPLLSYCMFPHIPVPVSSPPVVVLKDFTAKEKLAFIECLNVLLWYVAPKIGVNVRKCFSTIAQSLTTNLEAFTHNMVDKGHALKLV